jgi:hypothetical protein
VRTQFLDPQERKVWEKIAGDPALAEMIHCAILKVGDSAAAFTFGIEAGGVRYQIANHSIGNSKPTAPVASFSITTSPAPPIGESRKSAGAPVTLDTSPRWAHRLARPS